VIAAMLYLIGTDEAGYGPNLGPLVVAATLWRVSGVGFQPALPDLYERLSTGVTSDPIDDARLALADSKQLYASGDSLALLERGVLAALSQINRIPATWQSIWNACSPEHACDLPWHKTFDCLLPHAVTADDLASGSMLLRDTLTSAGVELVELRACVVHPADFNDRCDRLSNKASVLSATTLALVHELLQGRNDASVQIVCDKHGGRNRYAALVWEELAADGAEDVGGFPVQTLVESRAESIYRWRCGGHPREIRFVTKGERFLPAALASMTAKYLRELSMLAFNAFWAERVPNLRPTAGYPGDALRFWNDIEPMVRLARFEERQLWRVR
jgi:hypothetical protein